MPKISLPKAKYVGTTDKGNYKFTRKNSAGRNMPFYLSPSDYKRVKKHIKK